MVAGVGKMRMARSCALCTLISTMLFCNVLMNKFNFFLNFCIGFFIGTFGVQDSVKHYADP